MSLPNRRLSNITIPLILGSNKIKLNEHQIGVAYAIHHVHGIIVKHGLGTGKTITAIASFESLQNNVKHMDKSIKKLVAHVIVPAKLRENFKKELDYVGVNPKCYKIYSYEGYAKHHQGPYNNVVLILDEAHMIRNAASNKSIELTQIASLCFRVIILTGTPMVNFPSDIAVLLNMCHDHGSKHLPTSWGAFKSKYLKYEYSKKISLSFPFLKIVRNIATKNTRDLMDSFKNRISCVDSPEDNFPKAYFFSKRIEMSKEQYIVYNAMEKEMLDSNARKILGNGEDRNNSVLNSFLNKTRMISNSLRGLKKDDAPENSPKFMEVLSRILEENRYPVLVYSFFLDSGINPMEELLQKHELHTDKIIGSTKDEDVKKIVNKYNNGKLDILLISGAAGYGLDLKKTTQIHILEPSWNKAKVDQVIGRGIRYKSHSDLPESERYVNVYHWLSVIPRSIFSLPWSKVRPSADEYLYNISIQKDTVLNIFYKVICDSSIENNILQDKKIKDTSSYVEKTKNKTGRYDIDNIRRMQSISDI